MQTQTATVGPMLSSLIRLDAALGQVYDLIEEVMEHDDRGENLLKERRAAGLTDEHSPVESRADVAGLLEDLRGVEFVIRVTRDILDGVIPPADTVDR